MTERKLILAVSSKPKQDKRLIAIVENNHLILKVHTATLGERHFTEPEAIKCKWCGSDNNIKKGKSENGVQEYLCNSCGRKFTNQDNPYGMRSTVNQIGSALDMYYTGSSLADIARHFDVYNKNPVDRSTIYRWILKYTREAIKIFENIHPKVGDVWIADETVIKFNDVNHWTFDIIDRDSRFLLASYMSPNRGTAQAKKLMELAAERAGKIPKKVLTDSLKAYIDGIELVFGAETKHIQSSPFSEVDSTNIIERFQATIKERTKVLWGFKTPETAKLIIEGFLIHYNYFRPHLSLDKMTPAEYTGVKVPVKNWTELVRKVGGTI
jgi:transposase-like protein